jgi:hypothetical protein
MVTAAAAKEEEEEEEETEDLIAKEGPLPRLRTRNREHDRSLQEITRTTATITTT